jgi:hypothetical protein
MDTHAEMAASYRKRAGELREIAAELSSLVRRQFILEIINDCERRAAAEERLAKQIGGNGG